MARQRIHIKGLKEFLQKVNKLADGHAVKNEVATWIEAGGMEFLSIVQDEIIRLEAVDYRRLLNSFDKGGKGGVWRIKSGGLALEVGTNVEYAWYVNDGHFTINPDTRKDRRFVPGYWSGDRFIYQKGASTGMLLTLKWVEGKPYWDNAIKIYRAMFNKSFEINLDKWVKSLGE